MKKEKQIEILSEFFIRWKMGTSVTRIMQELKPGKWKKTEIIECKKIFDKWLNSDTKDWKSLQRLTK